MTINAISTNNIPKVTNYPVPAIDQYHDPVQTSSTLTITLAFNLTSEVTTLTQPNALKIFLIEYLMIAHLKLKTNENIHKTNLALLIGPKIVRLVTIAIQGIKTGVMVIPGTAFLSPVQLTVIV